MRALLEAWTFRRSFFRSRIRPEGRHPDFTAELIVPPQCSFSGKMVSLEVFLNIVKSASCAFVLSMTSGMCEWVQLKDRKCATLSTLLCFSKYIKVLGPQRLLFEITYYFIYSLTIYCSGQMLKREHRMYSLQAMCVCKSIFMSICFKAF